MTEQDALDAAAKADNIEICSDAQYRHSSYGIRAQAAATVFAEAMAGQAALLQAFMEANPPLTNAALRSELAAKDAELAELRAKVEKYEAILLESGDAHDYENLRNQGKIDPK